MATLNAFISDVDALNTSLLLAVQRLAMVTENNTQERNEEGEGSKKNTADQGSYGYFTCSEIPHSKYGGPCQYLSNCASTPPLTQH